MRLFGVLVTYDRHEQLEETLRRLMSQTRLVDELLVVDNGSDPAIEEMVSSWRGETGRRIEYLDPGDNLGPAGGYSLGIDQILGDAVDDDWVLLLDDDDPPFFDDALENVERFIAQVLQLDEGAGGVGISGGRFDRRRGLVVRIGDDLIHGPVLVDHITGGGLPAYRVKAIRQVGTPLEELFFGFEELELGLRLTDAGFPLYADGEQWRRRKAIKREQGLLPPEEVSIEKRRKRSVRVAESTWRRYYSMRNLIYILRRIGEQGTAVKISIVRGIFRPIVNLALASDGSWMALKLSFAAVRDAWTGEMGRTVEPD